MTTPIPVFDGHNDALLRLYNRRDNDPIGSFLRGEGPGHIDLPKARQGNLAGGLFAVFCPSPKPDAKPFAATDKLDDTMPPWLPIADARALTAGQIAMLLRLEAASDGAVSVCRSHADIVAAMAQKSLAAVLHIEGIEAVDEDLYFLDLLYAAGLRSLGPVWSRNNIFGHGVPFKFPADPDIGPGLTEAGKRLVAACNRLGIMVDLSHMNQKGFFDVAETSNAPLVATHSNVHAICPTPRNLTAEQFAAIRQTDGMVGLNFATGFLREDGKFIADTDLEWMVRHLDALIEAVGETRVGLGSDFDGAMIPHAIGSAAGLPVLFETLRKHGYSQELLERIAWRNWLSLLERTIG